MRPAGTPPCPDAAPGVVASVAGTIVASSVIGPSEQGIAPAEFEELKKIASQGLAYINLHTSAFPDDEIRGQVAVNAPQPANTASATS